MKLQQLFRFILVTGYVWILFGNSAHGEQVISTQVQNESIVNMRSPRINTQILGQQPPSSEVVQVTGVKANPANQGVEIILETTKGEQLQITNRSAGNSFIQCGLF